MLRYVREFLRFWLLLSLLWRASQPVTALAEDPSSPPSAQEVSAVGLSLRDALFDELARDAESFQRQYGIVKRVVRLVKPTIVHIDAYANGRDGSPKLDEAGSGIIIRINADFFVLTNRHVVDQSALKHVKIRTDEGELLRAVKQWSDPSTDVAVIRLANTDLLPARLGNSQEVEIGDFVLAVGSPFGLSHSVSYGIVSAKGRWDLALGEGDNVRFQDFLQTDAAINPGNSGGPLLNLKGQVIGINTAIASNSGGNEGIGFSIPINLAINVARQLVEQGTVSTAYLGVVLDKEFSRRLASDTSLAKRLGLPHATGAFVKAITAGSPAAEARIRRGDVIVEFNGVRVQDDDHLVNLVSLIPLNQVVAVNVVRSQRLHLMHVRMGRRSDFETADLQARR